METDAHPATTGPTFMPKTGKPARKEIKFPPSRQPDHPEKSGLTPTGQMWNTAGHALGSEYINFAAGDSIFQLLRNSE
ncbi:hypothetical protein AAGW05_16615 [Arthrobacter sp. LAPM80]|uniref:hypothetical protein n=1 Tax=Arthrobacter sp. LAPM80 TaxID=3141788 RepID=UPI00398B76C3